MLDKYINSYTLAMCRALTTIMVALKAIRYVTLHY